MQFTKGVTYTFPDGTTIPAGGRVVLVRFDPVLDTASLAAFRANYGIGAGVTILGPYDGKLDNGGEAVLMQDPLGTAMADFTYDDEDGWPLRADGHGSSLEVVDVNADYNDSFNWRSSPEFNGTPGSAGAGQLNGVLVNEVLRTRTCRRAIASSCTTPRPPRSTLGAGISATPPAIS